MCIDVHVPLTIDFAIILEEFALVCVSVMISAEERTCAIETCP